MIPERCQLRRFGAVILNCEICSKLTIKIPEQSQFRSYIFIINFEVILHIVLIFHFWVRGLSKQMPTEKRISA